MRVRTLLPLAVAVVAVAAPAAGATPKATDFSLSADEYSANESSGSVLITIRRLGEPGSVQETIRVRTADEPDDGTGEGRAVAGQDYVAVDEEVVFEGRETEQTITIDLLSDDIDEGEESFLIRLSSPSGAGTSIGDPSTATVRILDREPTLFQFCPPGSATPGAFHDVDPESVHAAAIYCVAAAGIAQGTAPGMFSPAANVNRGQVATFLRRVIDQTDRPLPDGPDSFVDDNGNVHEDNINALAEAGILRGTSISTFSPNDPVSRAQIAAFLVRTFEYVNEARLPTVPDAFDDDEGIALEPEINAAAAAGFARGTGERIYSPSTLVHRDQVASFLNRVLDRLVIEGHAEPQIS